GRDQFQLNSMTKFYFEKKGFNAYLADSAPNANRCDGLFAHIEELSSFLGTKLQLLIKDCNEQEIYRSPEGKSKYKEWQKSYQDALRQVFNKVAPLPVSQGPVALLPNNSRQNPSLNETMPGAFTTVAPKVSATPGTLLPDARFSNYSLAGKNYLLRKSDEGYSLYEKSSTTADGLLLTGKIIVMNNVVKFMDSNGSVADASFDASGNLTIKTGGTSTMYKSED